MFYSGNTAILLAISYFRFRVHFRPRTEQDSEMINKLENEVEEIPMEAEPPTSSSTQESKVEEKLPTSGSIPIKSALPAERLPSGAPVNQEFNNFKFPEQQTEPYVLY